MHYAMYLRKSRADIEAEARGEGETLERHRKALSDLASRSGFIVEKIYAEVVSGDTIASRPEMQKLLADVEDGRWSGVLVMDIDRLARGDTMDQGLVAQTFKNAECKIITPTKTFDPSNEFDEEYFEFGLYMARREYKAINRRIQRGRMASIQEGKYIGSVAPFGYDKVKIPTGKGYTLSPNPEQAPTVQMIYRLFLEGEALPDGTIRKMGTSMISRRLNELHITTISGQTWTGQAVREIIKNPTYMGKVRWGYRPYKKKRSDGQTTSSRHKKAMGEYTLVDGLHPPLIQEDDWYRAQELLKESKGFPVPYDYTLKNPLSGVLVCGLCGHAMARRFSSRERKAYLICTRQTCKNASSHFEKVETAFIKMLEEWLKQYKLEVEEDAETTPQKIDSIAVKTQAIKKLENELKTAQKQMNNLYDLLEQQIYTKEIFLQRSTTLQDKIQKANSSIQQLQAEIEEEKTAQISAEEFIPRFEHAIEFYKTSENIQAKNDLLKEVIEKVAYTREKGGRWADPEDFQLVITPRWPNATYHL